jgi:hypothetical protein
MRKQLTAAGMRIVSFEPWPSEPKRSTFGRWMCEDAHGQSVCVEHFLDSTVVVLRHGFAVGKRATSFEAIRALIRRAKAA